MRKIFACIALALLVLGSLRAEERYVLDNGKVRAVFSGGKTFAIEEIVVDGHKIAGNGSGAPRKRVVVPAAGAIAVR